MERAESVVSTFALVPENAPAVARLCQQLDGMPLAIDLAAARVRVLSVEQISARLDDCLRPLKAGGRMALPRHRTLRATIDWSHELLSKQERILFRRLSVFAGGFTLEAEEEVCAGAGIVKDEVLNLLTHLVDKSLILVEERGSEAHTGFWRRSASTGGRSCDDREKRRGSEDVTRASFSRWRRPRSRCCSTGLSRTARPASSARTSASSGRGTRDPDEGGQDDGAGIAGHAGTAMGSSQRQVADLPFPFPFGAQLRQQQDDVFDGGPDRHALVGVARHRAHVVREQDPALPRRLLEDRRVVGSREAHVLDADDVHLRLAAQDAAHDVAVEVLVGGQAQHAPLPAAAGEQPLAHPGGSKRSSFSPGALRHSALRARAGRLPPRSRGAGSIR